MTSHQHEYIQSRGRPVHAEHHSRSAHDFPTRTLPLARIGTFRLFRLLTLFPKLEIELRTFPYRDSGDLRDNANQPVSSSVGNRVSISSDVANVCPPYDAISYTWNPDPGPDSGPPLPTQQVIVHTSQSSQPIALILTSHLIYGLLAAQELCAPVWLFIDAICIDQYDSLDKSIQVQGMDRVFRGAERVFVWLGVDLSPPASDSSKGVKAESTRRPLPSDATGTYTGACLSRIPALVMALDAYVKYQENAQSEYQSRKAAGKGQIQKPVDILSNVPMASDTIWQDLERLRFNPYFMRLWVIQEVTLAKDPVLLYGRHSLPWQTYARLTSLCETIITSLFSKQHDAKLVNQLYFAYNSRVSAMVQLQRCLVGTQDNGPGLGGSTLESVQSLVLLIHNIRKSKASVPLDRVYAIVGLLSSPLRAKIRIDYSFDYSKKYWIKWVEFFQAILSLVPEVAEEVFSNAVYLEQHPELPSWCPNLADDSEKRGISGPGAKFAGMPNGEPWKTAMDVNPVSTIPETWYLRLLGLRVDEVAHVVDLSWINEALQWARIFVDQNADIDSDVAQKILVAFWKCLDHLREYNTSLDDGDKILARCLIAGSYDEQIVEPAKLMKDYMAFVGYLEHCTWGPMSSGSFKKAARSSALRFGDRFQRMARKRAVFVTSSGRVGLCSSKAKANDVLCVVMNCRLPYLLRKHAKDGMYRLMGETYVDGLMQGEAFQGRDMAKQIPEEYVIY